jgi:hypothetical protein
MHHVVTCVMIFVIVRAWGEMARPLKINAITHFSCSSCRIARDWTWRMLVRKESKFFLYNFVLTRITDKTAKLLQVPKMFVGSKSKAIRQSVSLLVSFPFTVAIAVAVNLRPTVSRPVCPSVRRPSGTCDQFFFLPELFPLKVKVTLRPTVSQYVLLYSPIWDFWPEAKQQFLSD